MAAACIGALTFDLDDTLWDNRPVLAAAENTLHDWLSVHYPRLAQRYDTDALHRLRLQTAMERPELRHNLSALRRNSLRSAASNCAYPASVGDAAFEVFLEARQRVSLYDDVLPALQALAGRYRLGALTNGNADVNRVGLGHLFDFSLSAVDAGAAKPAPAIFHLACERAALSPRQVVHIGDDLEKDVAAARKAGLHAIWINRQGLPPSPALAPEAQITSLTQLPGLIAGLCRRTTKRSSEVPDPLHRGAV